MTNMLGRLYLAAGQPVQAESYLRRALALAPGDPPSEVRADQLEGLGLALAQQGRPEATGDLTRALEMNEALGRSDRVARIREAIGTHHLRSGQPDRAKAFYADALAYHNANGNTEDAARLRRNMAALLADRGNRNEKLAADHAKSGDWAAAEARLEGALAQFTALQQGADAARIYMKLGEARRALDRPGAAEADYRTALALFRSFGDDAGISRALIALAIGQLDAGRLAPAADSLEAAVAAQRELGDDEGRLRSHETLAGIYRDLEREDDAIRHHNSALGLALALTEDQSAATQLAQIGLARARQGDMASACQSWTQSAAIFARLNAAPQSQEVSSWMTRANCAQ